MKLTVHEDMHSVNGSGLYDEYKESSCLFFFDIFS